MALNGGSSKGKILKRADPSTIQDKFLVGYQGWFTCAGDGEPVGPGHHGWLHWFNHPMTEGGRPNTDLWPDVSAYSPSELFPAPGLKMRSGEQALLFSSRHPKTVQRHFNWMAQHGVDGAFLQRFAGQCDLEAGNEGIMRIRDEVGDRVREAAEKEGRVFAIMYDVSGVAPDRIQRVIERDWIHLIRDNGILDSPNYLKEKGRPVIALWGFGFDNAGHTPSQVRAITSYIRSVTPGGAYIMAGTPAHWRTAESDADRNSEFLDVWLNDFDAISPWTVGRYNSERDADNFAETKMKGDVELLKKRNEEGRWRKVDYIPVVLPGGSGFNLSEGKWSYNDIKRNGGRFLWKQIFNARRLGVRVMYGAMWDEYDEGTAFMPVVEHKRLLPESDRYPFMALDEDGYDLPSDWYMRICGFAAEGLRSERRIHETFPSKELQDYWSSRPKYEDVDPKSGDFTSGSQKPGGEGSSGGDGQSYQAWLATQKEDKEEPPPPPYSLEAGDVSGAPQSAASASASGSGSAASTQPAPTPVRAPSPIPATQPAFSAPPISQMPVSGPPPVNVGSRPPETYHNPGDYRTAGEAVSSNSFQGSIVSLTNDFGRHGISPPLGRIPAGVPPPIHPAHPAAPGRSHSYSSSRPNTIQTRPPQLQPSYPSPSPPPVPAAKPQASNIGQWPPPEWGLNNNQGRPQQQDFPQQHQHPYAQETQAYPPYPGQASTHPSVGANLTRPQSFTASSHPTSPTDVRPHASTSHRPTPTQGPITDNVSSSVSQVDVGGPASPHPASSYATPPASSYIGPPFPSGPSHSPGPAMPSFQSSSSSPIYPPGGLTYPGLTSHPETGGSAYAPAPGSSYPSQGYPPSHMSPSHSPDPMSPHAPAGYPGSSYNYGQGSSYPGQPYSGAPPAATSSHNPQSGTTSYGNQHGQAYGLHQGPPSFPQAQGNGGGGFFDMPQQSHYQPSSYPGQHNSPPHHASPYPPHAPSPGPNPGSWFPGGPGGPVPPPVPPRPSSHAPYGQQPSHSGISFPTPSTAGATALGYALNAVDKVAGKKKREQLESGVGSLAQTGSKLFNKLTK